MHGTHHIMHILSQLDLYEESPVADLIPAFTMVHPIANSPYSRRTAVAITNALTKYGYPTVLQFKQASPVELCSTRRLTNTTCQSMVLAIHKAIQEVTLLSGPPKSLNTTPRKPTISLQDDMLEALSPYTRRREDFSWCSKLKKLYASMNDFDLPKTVEGFLSLTPEMVLSVPGCSTRTTQHVKTLQNRIRAIVDYN